MEVPRRAHSYHKSCQIKAKMTKKPNNNNKMPTNNKIYTEKYNN